MVNPPCFRLRPRSLWCNNTLSIHFGANMLKSEKLILVRYPTLCRTCRSKVLFGEKAIWQPGYGITSCRICCPSGSAQKMGISKRHPSEYSAEYYDEIEDESFILPDIGDR